MAVGSRLGSRPMDWKQLPDVGRDIPIGPFARHIYRAGYYASGLRSSNQVFGFVVTAG